MVEPVGDGLAALRVIECRLPDLVILDLGLPRLSGYDVQEEMAAQPTTRHIPIVVITGDASGADRLAARPHVEVLCKPIDAGRLIAAVKRQLREARSASTSPRT